MIGIVVISHGTLAGGLDSAVSLLAGKPEQFETVELHPGDAPDTFKERVEQAIAAVDTGDGVLALVDIFGGTPSNTISQLMGNPSIQAVAGVNLAMVIQAVFMREQYAIGELPSQILQAGSEALVDIRQVLVAAAASDDDDEDF